MNTRLHRVVPLVACLLASCGGASDYDHDYIETRNLDWTLGAGDKYGKKEA